MTITLDSQPATILHPLDLTAYPLQSGSTSTTGTCIGLIQTANGQMDNANNGLDDFILGVPFLRNTYTVMAYEAPDSNGNFGGSNAGSAIDARLGLLSLTEPTTALDEFHTVRVLNQPLSGSGGAGSAAGSSAGDKKLGAGLIMLIAFLSLFGACLGLFGVRWWVMRRRWKRAKETDDDADMFGTGGYVRMGAMGRSEYSLADLQGTGSLARSRDRDSEFESSPFMRRSSGDNFGHGRSQSSVSVAEPLLARTRSGSRIQVHGEDGSLISDMDPSTGAMGPVIVSAGENSMHARTASNGSTGSNASSSGARRPGSSVSGFGEGVNPGMLLPPSPLSPRFPRVAPSPPPLEYS